MMDSELASDYLPAIDTAHICEIAQCTIGKVTRTCRALRDSGLQFGTGGKMVMVIITKTMTRTTMMRPIMMMMVL